MQERGQDEQEVRRQAFAQQQQQQYHHAQRMSQSHLNTSSGFHYPDPSLMHQAYSNYPQQHLEYQTHLLPNDQSFPQRQQAHAYAGQGYGYQQPYPNLPLQQQSSLQNYAAVSPSARPAIKSPRQQFSDTLRKGVQNFAFNPSTANVVESSGTTPRSTNVSHPGMLPPRPNSAIWASQSGLGGENGIAASASGSQSQHSHQGHSNRNSSGLSSVNQVTGPPPPAPTIPLSSRFPPLPSKPNPSNDADISKDELRKCFEAREEALILRIEALGFQPESAWQTLNEAVDGKQVEDNSTVEDLSQQENRERPAPILGIRLLQRLDLLQRENEELEGIFAKKMQKDEEKDSLRLIDALDKALTEMTKRAEQAEARATSSDRALAVACAQVSSAIVAEPNIKSKESTSSSPPWNR